MYVEVANGMMDQLVDSSVMIAYSANFCFLAYGSRVLVKQHFYEGNVVTLVRSKSIILNSDRAWVMNLSNSRKVFVDVSFGVNTATAAIFRMQRATCGAVR